MWFNKKNSTGFNLLGAIYFLLIQHVLYNHLLSLSCALLLQIFDKVRMVTVTGTTLAFLICSFSILNYDIFCLDTWSFVPSDIIFFFVTDLIGIPSSV